MKFVLCILFFAAFCARSYCKNEQHFSGIRCRKNFYNIINDTEIKQTFQNGVVDGDFFNIVIHKAAYLGNTQSFSGLKVNGNFYNYVPSEKNYQTLLGITVNGLMISGHDTDDDIPEIPVGTVGGVTNEQTNKNFMAKTVDGAFRNIIGNGGTNSIHNRQVFMSVTVGAEFQNKVQQTEQNYQSFQILDVQEDCYNQINV